MKAYVLIQTRPGSATDGEMRSQIAEIPGVLLAELVTGPYDLIAMVEVHAANELAQRVVPLIAAAPGVNRVLAAMVGGPALSHRTVA